MRKKITTLIVSIFFLSACDDRYITLKTLTITANTNKPGTSSVVMVDSLKHFEYSRLKGKSQGGLIGTYTVTPEHSNKQLYVIVSGKIRTNYAHSNSNIIIAATDDKNELILWRGIYIQYYYTEINKWCPFKDSMLLPPSVNNKYYKEVSALAYLGNSENENFDIDTLKIEIKEKL